MAVALQIRLGILETILTRTIQATLNATCLAPIGSYYIDRADVGSEPVETVLRDQKLFMKVRIHIFIVEQMSLVTSPNTAVPSELVIQLPLELTFSWATDGAFVVLRLESVDFGIASTLLDPTGLPTKEALQSYFRPVLVDLVGLNAQFNKRSAPPAMTIELKDGVVRIVLEASGAAPPLPLSMQWGISLDSLATARMLAEKIKSILPSDFNINLNASWQPVGPRARVHIAYSGKVAVPDPYSGDVNGTLDCDLSLQTGTLAELDVTVSWTLNVTGNALGFMDAIARDDAIAKFNPTDFGAIPNGEYSFVLATQLPRLQFGRGKLSFGALAAGSDGISIGGQVSSTDPGRPILDISVTPFGRPMRVSICSVDGEHPQKTAKLNELCTSAQLYMTDLGSYGGMEWLVAEDQWMSAYVAPYDDPQIRMAIPSTVAAGISKSVRFIVRTARGVRHISFGTPPQPILDADQNVTNAILTFIPNCLYERVGHEFSWEWGVTQKTPPLELPEWADFLQRSSVLDIEILDLTGLVPGEIIQYRSAYHSIDASADALGRLSVPVFRAFGFRRERATVRRVNHQDLSGKISSRTITLVWNSTLPAEGQQGLTALSSSRSLLTTTMDGRPIRYELGSFGGPVRIKADLDPERESSSQASPYGGDSTSVTPETHPVVRRLSEAGVRGLQSVQAIPGFADAPVAVARMKNGTQLLLDLKAGEQPRVAGTFNGPLGRLDLAGSWAFTASQGQISLYRVIRSTSEKGCSCQGFGAS